MTDIVGTAEATPANNVTALMTAASAHLGPRTRKALSFYVVAGGALGMSRKWYDRARQEFVYQVSVDSTDDLYADVQGWVLDRVPSRRQRSLIARSMRNSDEAQPISSSGFPGSSPRRTEKALRLAYEIGRAHV